MSGYQPNGDQVIETQVFRNIPFVLFIINLVQGLN